MEWRRAIDLVGIDIEGRGRVRLARCGRGFEDGEALCEVAHFEELGGDQGAPEHGVGAGDGGIQAEQVEGGDLGEAEDAVDRAEALVQVIGALQRLLAAAAQATEASGLDSVGLVIGMMPEAKGLIAHGRGAAGRAVAGAGGAGGGPSNT